jgi:hypothetical protein
LGLAGGGAWASGFLSVDAVGGGLFVSGHVRLPFNSGVARRLGENGGWKGEVVWNEWKKVENCRERGWRSETFLVR